MDSLVIYSEKDFHSEDRLASAVISSISAKQHGYEGILAPLVAKACAATMPKKPQNFVVENVRVCKIHGGSVSQSEVVSGIVLDRDVEGQVKSKTGAKIAIFNESVDSIDTETKGTVRLNGAQDLLNYNESEEKHIETVITNLKNLGVDVVVSGGKFGEMALHYIEKFGMMAVRVMSKHELRRLAQAVRGRMVVTLGTTTLEDLGYADEVFVRELGLQKVTIFNRSKEETAISTIILRSSTQNLLNDFERAVEDGINVIRAMTRDPRFVAGAGAFEIELARIISAFGEKCSGLEQYAVKKFGEALEAFPRTLAENAGLDATDIVSKLYAAHERGETRVGVDIDSSEVSDMTSQGIYDLLCSKIQAMKLAVNAVNTVLRVDQIIMAKPAGGPRMPNRSGNWDDDD